MHTGPLALHPRREDFLSHKDMQSLMLFSRCIVFSYFYFILFLYELPLFIVTYPCTILRGTLPFHRSDCIYKNISMYTHRIGLRENWIFILNRKTIMFKFLACSSDQFGNFSKSSCKTPQHRKASCSEMATWLHRWNKIVMIPYIERSITTKWQCCYAAMELKFSDDLFSYVAISLPRIPHLCHTMLCCPSKVCYTEPMIPKRGSLLSDVT